MDIDKKKMQSLFLIIDQFLKSLADKISFKLIKAFGIDINEVKDKCLMSIFRQTMLLLETKNPVKVIGDLIHNFLETQAEIS